MADFNLKEGIDQFKDVFRELSLVKKVSIFFTIALSIYVLTFLYQLSTKSNYQVLFSNLESEDVGEVASALDKYKIAYQVQSETRSILVPGDKVLETRLKLAQEGLPRFGGVGFEIFDEKSFGMTEFEQRLNFQRALQGELERTINNLEEVDDSRVHLVIPEKTVFVQSRETPSASVVIKMARGARLPESTVQSIVNLVSASVANLEAKAVTVVDTTGQLLTADVASEGVASYKKKDDIERSFESKVLALLEPIVGLGKVKVQVTADLDFTEKQTTEEKYDPESIAIRSERRSKVKEEGGASSAGGVAGTGTQGAAGTSSGKNKNEQNETIEYEVSKQIQHIVNPVGELEKLSVAVVVDGNYDFNDDGEAKYVARSEEELKNYEELIKSAIGFDQERGDQLKVMNLAFQNLDEVFENKGSFWQEFWSDRNTYTFYMSLLINVTIFIVALLIIFFVLVPIGRTWISRQKMLSAQLQDRNSPQLNPEGEKRMLDTKMKDQLQQQALEDPDSMVNVLRSWLS